MRHNFCPYSRATRWAGYTRRRQCGARRLACAIAHMPSPSKDWVVDGTPAGIQASSESERNSIRSAATLLRPRVSSRDLTRTFADNLLVWYAVEKRHPAQSSALSLSRENVSTTREWLHAFLHLLTLSIIPQKIPSEGRIYQVGERRTCAKLNLFNTRPDKSGGLRARIL